MANGSIALPRLKSEDIPIALSALFILVILLAGTGYTLSTMGSAPLLSPNYLLTQLQTGSFLGIIAATVFSGLVVRRRLDHLDLVAVLKIRE